MSVVDDIKALLTADGTFTGLMSGGTYTVAELGPLGPSRDTQAALYDAQLRLKPICIIASRNALSTRAIQDTGAQRASMRQAVELYFYADQYAGHTTPAAARQRAYTLLHGKRTASGAHLLWSMDVEQQYERAVDDACYERSDYEAYQVKG